MDIEKAIQHVRESIRVYNFAAFGEMEYLGSVTQTTKDKIEEKEIILDALLEKQKKESVSYEEKIMRKLCDEMDVEWIEEPGLPTISGEKVNFNRRENF